MLCASDIMFLIAPDYTGEPNFEVILCIFPINVFCNIFIWRPIIMPASYLRVFVCDTCIMCLVCQCFGYSAFVWTTVPVLNDINKICFRTKIEGTPWDETFSMLSILKI